MFAYFVNLLERAEYTRRDTFLAAAIDMHDLERRMRAIEMTD